MKDFILRLKEQVVELWKKTTVAQRAVVIGSTLLIFLVLYFFINSATQPDYAQLFSNMDETSANSAITSLKAQNISYKLTDGGKTILIPSKDVYEQRIKLTSEGVATGNVVDFSIFDKQTFGETDTDRKVKFMRALQGELTRTIENFPEVESARVHIVTPADSLFAEKQKDATAAVWLKLKYGKKMNDGQVAGLIKLVSSSVEGMKPQNVTVVDDSGNVLSNKNNQSTDASDTQKYSENQLKLQQNQQDAYQSSIQSMLDKVMGAGQSVVRVQVELDLDQVEKTQTVYDGNKVIVSQQKDEQASKNSPDSGGLAGTSSNLPDSPSYNSTTSGTSESSKTSSITNYEPNKATEHRLVNPGSVKKLSVAVVFNGEIDQQKQKTIEDVVRNAAGIDNKRGDTISVVAMPFNTKDADQFKATVAKDAQTQQILFYGKIALGLLAVVIIGLLIRRVMRGQEGVISEEDVFPIDLISAKNASELVSIDKELTPEEREKQLIKEQVEKVASQNPADVATLLKSWLAEE